VFRGRDGADIVPGLVGVLLVTGLLGCTGGNSGGARPSSSTSSATPSSTRGASSGEPSAPGDPAEVRALVRQYLPWRPPSIGSAVGTVPQWSKATSPARLEVLQVQSTATSTVVRMRMTSARPVRVRSTTEFSRGLKIHIDIAGLRLDVPSSRLSLWPDLYRQPPGTVPSACVCSAHPADIDPEGVQLSAAFPALPQGATSVVVRMPGFKPVTVPVAAAAGTSAPSPSTSADPSIPVLGVTSVAASRSAADSEATVLVHGVRRVPGGTVLYYSIGTPQGQRFLSTAMYGFRLWGKSTRDPIRRDGALLVDHVHNKVYDTLVKQEGGPALATPIPALNQTEPGRFTVVYQVLPALPPDVTTVDLRIGHGDVVAGLPVQDGVMTPEVEQGDKPVELGSGWPRIDLKEVVAAYQPGESVYDLQSTISATDESVTIRRRPGAVQVDLSADVLFAVDSATLTPAATSRLRAVADDLNSQAKAGVVQIVGYTDNTGSGPYNDKLSLARARAVAKAVQRLVTQPGFTFQVSGKGEREPVATNSTDEGRRANRRVTVSFTPAGG